MTRPAAALAAISIVLSLAASTGTSATSALRVAIVNQSGRDGGNVYVMLHNGSSSDGKLVDGVPKKLSEIGGRTFTLGSISAGRIFFSYGGPVTAAEPPLFGTRYDKVELTYPGVANLTSVDFFGIPFRLEAFDGQGNSLGTLNFDAPTQTVKNALLKIPGASGALVKTSNGQFARVLSPQLSRESYPGFDQDIASMAGKGVTLRGAFYGTPYQTFVYSGTFGADGSIKLKGTIAAPNGGSPSPPLAVAVTGSSLPQAIYTVDGPYRVGGQPAQVATTTSTRSSTEI